MHAQAPVRQKAPKQGRHDCEDRDPVLGEQTNECRHVVALIGRGDDRPTSRQDRPERFAKEEGRIQRRLEHMTVGFVEPEIRTNPGTGPQASMPARDGLGNPGRARGEHHGRQILRARRHPRRVRRFGGDRARLRIQHQHVTLNPPEPGTDERIGDQNRGSSGCQQGREAIGGERRLQGDKCPAGLQDREQADHQLGRTIQADADAHVGADPSAAKGVGQPVGPDVELAEGQTSLLEDDRDGVGSAPTCSSNAS